MNLTWDRFANCLETIYLNLINYYNLPNNKIIYSYSWDFGYTPPNGLFLDERLSNTKDTHLQQKLLETYFGIKITWIKGREEIKKQLSFEQPFIVCFDSYWCPWTKAYQRDHVPHYFIVRSKDIDILQCCDYYFNMLNLQLEYKYFDKGCTKIGYISKSQGNEYYFMDVFRDSINYVISSYNGLGDYTQIRTLAKEIKENKYIFETIRKRSNQIENSKTLLAINHINNGRLKYISHWCQYIGREQSEAIKYVTEELTGVTIQWKRILTMMIRFCLEDYKREKILKLYDDLMEVADKEESIANIAYEKLKEYMK